MYFRVYLAQGVPQPLLTGPYCLWIPMRKNTMAGSIQQDKMAYTMVDSGNVDRKKRWRRGGDKGRGSRNKMRPSKAPPNHLISLTRLHHLSTMPSNS